MDVELHTDLVGDDEAAHAHGHVEVDAVVLAVDRGARLEAGVHRTVHRIDLRAVERDVESLRAGHAIDGEVAGHEVVPGIPFDERNGIIPNRDGRVLDPTTNAPVPRLYVAGWIKRGPSGVIGTNKPDAAATVQAMLEDAAQYPVWDGLSLDLNTIPSLLAAKQVRTVTFTDWKRIDQIEIAAGKKRGKPREKLTTIAELLATVN